MSEPFDGRTPEEACKAFLQEMGTSVHLMQQGFDTMIITTLRREELMLYLTNVVTALADGLDVGHNEDNTDLVHVEQEMLPDGSSRMAAILKVEVSPR